MFHVTSEPTFTHPVTVMVPIDGGHREETFKATFRVVPTDEASKFNLMSEEGTRQFLVRAIVRLDELVDGQDNAIPYSDEIRDAVIRRPDARLALSAAYFEAVSKAKGKN